MSEFSVPKRIRNMAAIGGSVLTIAALTGCGDGWDYAGCHGATGAPDHSGGPLIGSKVYPTVELTERMEDRESFEAPVLAGRKPGTEVRVEGAGMTIINPIALQCAGYDGVNSFAGIIPEHVDNEDPELHGFPVQIANLEDTYIGVYDASGREVGGAEDTVVEPRDMHFSPDENPTTPDGFVDTTEASRQYGAILIAR